MNTQHLNRLEAESIYIIREVVAQAANPVMLYSMGKDSSVLLHLVQKSFYPQRPPLAFLHIDTGWKFHQMILFRELTAKKFDLNLLVHQNPRGNIEEITPFTYDSVLYTEIMKTEALIQALDKYKFDIAIGGARRDEEKSRSKERVFSFRTKNHCWDPRNQRPGIWQIYNGYKQAGESIRAFPLSNWTELDVWKYIKKERLPIVPLYFSAPRPIVYRDDTLILAEDNRLPLKENEKPTIKKVRFRTLGCFPLTGAVESSAETISDIIEELLIANTSERIGRVIDSDQTASMEKKKQRGYF